MTRVSGFAPTPPGSVDRSSFFFYYVPGINGSGRTFMRYLARLVSRGADGKVQESFPKLNRDDAIWEIPKYNSASNDQLFARVNE
jgi:hypothetical protein